MAYTYSYLTNPAMRSALTAFRPSYGGPQGLSAAKLYAPALPSPYAAAAGQAPAVSPYANGAPAFQPAAYGGSGVFGAASLAAGGAIGPKSGVGRAGANAFGGGGSKGGVGGTGGGGGGGGGDTGDPVVAKAQAQASAESSQAYAAMIAAMKQNLIRYGDPDMVQRVMGGKIRVYTHGALAGQDKQTEKGYKYAQTQQAAANNPFSTVKELGRWNDRALTGVNESANNNGLFFSSNRARNLALQGEDFTRQKTKAANDLQDAIDAIQQAYINAMGGVQSNLQNAYATSYYNAQQRAAASGGY